MTATDNKSSKGYTRKEQGILRTIPFKKKDKIERALCQNLLPKSLISAASGFSLLLLSKR